MQKCFVDSLNPLDASPLRIMLKSLSIYSFFLVGFCYQAMTDNTNEDTLFDDMLVEDTILINHQYTKRNAVQHDNQLWPKGVVVYEIDSKLKQYTPVFRQAMQEYEANTCIKFKKRTNEESYLNIVKGAVKKCSSKIGWHKYGGRMNLVPECMNVGSVLHELGHVIGFRHEHNRPDRDQYLNINFENVAKDKLQQFKIVEPGKTRLLGPFDYDSIMIYGETAGSIDPKRLKVMTAKKPGVTLKHPSLKKKLSDWDKIKINKLYKCEKEDQRFLSAL